jgi:hypothetical protein
MHHTTDHLLLLSQRAAADQGGWLLFAAFPAE